MICCANTTSETNKAGSDGVSDPDADPSLPPGEADFERGGSNHPSVDIEGVGNPESDKIPCFPLSSFRLDDTKIMVGKEELFVG